MGAGFNLKESTSPVESEVGCCFPAQLYAGLHLVWLDPDPHAAPCVLYIRVPLSSVLTAERRSIASPSSPSPSPVSDNGAKLRQRAFLIPLFKKEQIPSEKCRLDCWVLVFETGLYFSIVFLINSFLSFLSFCL